MRKRNINEMGKFIMLTDIEIAQMTKLAPIRDIAAKLGIDEEELEYYGRYKAKLSQELIDRTKDKENGKLILVTAINPTPAGEGKTTTSVGLADAMSLLGKKTLVCLREPSLGPVFGVKGGAAGGGYAQVVPMEDINLHFTEICTLSPLQITCAAQCSITISSRETASVSTLNVYLSNAASI